MDENMNTYFIANEIAKLFGYKDPNKIIAKLLEKKYKVSYSILKDDLNLNIKKNNKELHSMTIFLTESGLYKLVMKSKKEEAVKFQDWLVDDVLPKLRKTGQYKMNKEMRKLVDKLIEKNKKKNGMIKRLTNKLSERTYEENDQVYIMEVESYDEKLYKIGRSEDLNKRTKAYKTGRKSVNIVYNERCDDSKLVENIIKYKLKSYRYEKNKELYNAPLESMIKTIKETIKELKDGKINTPIEELLSESDKELE